MSCENREYDSYFSYTLKKRVSFLSHEVILIHFPRACGVSQSTLLLSNSKKYHIMQFAKYLSSYIILC